MSQNAVFFIGVEKNLRCECGVCGKTWEGNPGVVEKMMQLHKKLVHNGKYTDTKIEETEYNISKKTNHGVRRLNRKLERR